MADVEYVATAKNKVQTTVGYVNYDYLVVATGSSNNFYGLKNIEKYSIGLKEINDAINIRSWMMKYFSYEKANQLVISRYNRE